MPRTCPVCSVPLPRRATQCDDCGALLPIDDAPRRRRREDDGLMFGGAFRSWGFIAGAIVYVPGVVIAATLFIYLAVTVPRNNPGGMIQGVVYFSLLAPLLPASLVWMVVDSIHATWNWAQDPRGPATPWLHWWAGPARLGLLLVPPLLGCGGGLVLAGPAHLLLGAAIGAGAGAALGIAGAAVISVIVRAMS